MNIEQMKEIVNNAPDGATHCFDYGDYFKYGDPFALFWDEKGSWFASAMCKKDVTHNLSDLRQILAQHEEIERLKATISSSLNNLEYAAFNLCESTEIKSKSGGRVVETTCPEGSLLIAIRDLKEANQLREQSE